MENILIIKTAAAGDVVRSTVLLHVVKGNIYWITDSKNTGVFPDDFPKLTVICSDSIPQEILSIEFDLVINLEEGIDFARLVSNLNSKKVIGVYDDGGTVTYTDDSALWFDMSLISKLGKATADHLKRENTLTFQQIVFKMIGCEFSGEPYLIYKLKNAGKEKFRIGIENRTGVRWPNKRWHGFDALRSRFLEDGFDVVHFTQRNSLREYFHDIQKCALIISGDTLAMHVALAYRIPCLAIFNCTSPAEIFDYGILTKMVSPLLERVFYQQNEIREVIHSIPLNYVYQETRKLIALLDQS